MEDLDKTLAFIIVFYSWGETKHKRSGRNHDSRNSLFYFILFLHLMTYPVTYF